MAVYDSSTALIIVDVQNDFADPSGSLYVSGGETIVPLLNEEMTRARDAGAFVVYTQDWHPPSTPHFQRDGGVWPVHCVQETWGAEFHPGLHVEGKIVRKGTGGEDGYSGFTIRHPESSEEESTELADLLKKRGIECAVVVGLATDYCVKDTALDALRLGFATTVRADAMRAVDLQPGDGDRALAEMTAAGARLD